MNPQLAQQLKTEGLAATAAANLDWCHLMRPVLVSWLEHRTAAGNRTFRMEEFRAYCAEVGENWLPKSHKTWGAFTLQMVAAGVIEWTGEQEPAQSPETHGKDVKTWRKPIH